MKKLLLLISLLFVLALPSAQASDGGAQAIEFGPYLDSAGTLYPSPKIYHYSAGTTNTLTCWSDENKSTAAAQPFIGDTSGIALIYCDGDYKFRIDDTDDNTLYTRDNWKVTSDTATMWEGNFGTAYSSATSSNKWQTFLKHDASDNILEFGVNNGTRFVQINGSEIDIREFDAVPDDGNDDTSNIQAAIDSVTYGIIFFPCGIWEHTGITGKAGITLQGENRECSELRYTPTTGDAIALGADPDWFSIRDMFLNANNLSSGWALESNTGINRSINISNVAVSGFLKGFQINGALNVYIENCRMNGRGGNNSPVAGGIGIQVIADASARSGNGVTIDSCHINTWELGIEALAGYTAVIRPVFEDNGTAMKNSGVASVYMPWTSSSAASDNGLDFDIQSPMLILGYGSSTWNVSFLNSTVQDRTIIIPERNDRAIGSGAAGGPEGIKLGKILIEDDGHIWFLDSGTVRDTNLYRSAANLLRTDDGFQVLTLNITGGNTITEHYSVTGVLDFPSISANTTSELTITVTGAAVGDSAYVMPSGSPETGLIWSGHISAADTVTVRIGNVTTGAINPASRTWRADAWAH